MDRKAFIAMLNKDLADEHASIVRYLIHAYQVGESTPFGQMLLSTAREEMWHMDWLGDELGEMGEEPGMEQGVYPYDGTSKPRCCALHRVGGQPHHDGMMRRRLR